MTPAQKPHRSEQNYATPPDFIEAVQSRLGIGGFAHDFAADGNNTKAPTWFSEGTNALTTPNWAAWCRGGWGWLNPPGWEDYICHEKNAVSNRARRREDKIDGRSRESESHRRAQRADEDLSPMQYGASANTRMVRAKTGCNSISESPVIVVPNLHQESCEVKAGAAPGRSYLEATCARSKSSLRLQPEGASLQAEAKHYVERCATEREDQSAFQMDIGRLGCVSTGMGEPLRVLPSELSTDSGSLYPSQQSGLPRDDSVEYGSSVPSMQRQQRVAPTGSVGHGQRTTCYDYGTVGVARPSAGLLNTPFASIGPWATRCCECKAGGGSIALLVPAAVGSNWFRDCVDGRAHVLLLNGRLAFIPDKPKWMYPKDAILCLFSPSIMPGYEVWTWRKHI